MREAESSKTIKKAVDATADSIAKANPTKTDAAKKATDLKKDVEEKSSKIKDEVSKKIESAVKTPTAAPKTPVDVKKVETKGNATVAANVSANTTKNSS